MCDECLKLADEVAEAELDVHLADQELCDAERDLENAKQALSRHHDECRTPEAEDQWAYHLEAERKGQMSLLKGAA